MKKNDLFGFLFMLVLGSITQPACYYDNEAELYPNTTCDTTAVQYSVEVLTILEANCNTCHTGANSVSGFPMETHDLLKLYAEDGVLVNRIKDATNPMPPTGLMSDCDISKIEAWVKAGALNN